MCLYVKDKSVAPQTATEPIKVYKVLQSNSYNGKGRWVTPVVGKRVRFFFGKRRMGDGKMDGYVIHRNLFQNINVFWDEGEMSTKSVNIGNDYPDLKSVSDVVVEKGIHAYTKVPSFVGYKKAVFEAEIPKGAHYFIGHGDEIVADRMIIYKNKIKESTIKFTI